MTLEQVLQLIERLLPYGLALWALFMTYSNRKVITAANKADVAVKSDEVEVEKGALAIERERFFLRAANDKDEIATDARKARIAAEEAVTAAKVAADALLASNAKITDMQTSLDTKDAQIKTLEERVESLERQQVISKTELNAEREEVKRLNALLLTYAAAAPPGNLQPTSPAEPVHMVIDNAADNPVPVIEQAATAEDDEKPAA